MKTSAVVPAEGIGDALLMLIASYNLEQAGYQVITYQPLLTSLSPWLKTKQFKALPNTYELEAFLKSADLILLQNDNSAKAKHLISLRKEKRLPQLAVFYPTYKESKHGQLAPQDYVFNSELSMAENIAKGISKLLNLAGVSKNNGMSPLQHLTHRKYKNRVVIHPSSSSQEKNWPASKFSRLKEKLIKKGFDVVIAVSPSERQRWQELFATDIPFLSTLSDLAELIYESGYVIGNDSLACHLASNLQVPSLIVADDEKRMKLWRPGWLKAEVITPSSFWLRLFWFKRGPKHWTHLISVTEVFGRFKKLTRSR